MRTFIIGEIGSAWRMAFEPMNSDYCMMALSVKTAKDAGCDAIKFQWCSAPRLMEQRRNVPAGTYDILNWSEQYIRYISEECINNGIEFMCSVYLQNDVDILNPHVKRWKVASLENRANDLYLAMEATGKPIIVSHGATALQDEPWGWKNALHCSVAYPADLDQLNLNAIRTMNYSGYSDHSCHELTGALAVACGARIVEVHFRLDDTPEDNPDYTHSLSPDRLKRYVENIRLAEKMLGDGKKMVMPNEEWARKHKVQV